MQNSTSIWLDDHWPEVLVGGAIILVLILITWISIESVKYEHNNPCLEYGPKRFLYFQDVGGAQVPIYGRDCLKRSRRSDIDAN